MCYNIDTVMLGGYYVNNKMSSLANKNVEEAYMLWLKGASLRKLGRQLGVSRTTVMSWFRKQYGKDATNRSKTSLSKSLLSDYGESVESLALSVLGSEGNYLSKHSVNMYTKYECMSKPEIMNYIATYEDVEDEREGLKLVFFKLLVDSITVVLRGFLDDTSRKSQEAS